MTTTRHRSCYIITGAGKGLGRAYALHLAAGGACIVVNNRAHAGEQQSSAEQVVSEIRAAGGQAVANHANAQDPGSGEQMLRTALDSFGRLDGLIANAGITEGRSLHKQSLQQLEQTLAINLHGTLYAVHAAWRHLYQQRSGAIVVSTSGAGLYSEHGLSAYSTSKAGVIGLMRALAKEGAGHGVRINAIAPYAATQMTDHQLPEELRARLSPDRVAPVVAWLLHPECKVSGEVVVTGAGRLSRARVCETIPVDLPSNPSADDLAAAWAKLEGQPLELEYSGALAHFAGFMKTG